MLRYTVSDISLPR